MPSINDINYDSVNEVYNQTFYLTLIASDLNQDNDSINFNLNVFYKKPKLVDSSNSLQNQIKKFIENSQSPPFRPGKEFYFSVDTTIFEGNI